jgi:hypothetical protein
MLDMNPRAARDAADMLSDLRREIEQTTPEALGLLQAEIVRTMNAAVDTLRAADNKLRKLERGLEYVTQAVAHVNKHGGI